MRHSSSLSKDRLHTSRRTSPRGYSTCDFFPLQWHFCDVFPGPPSWNNGSRAQRGRLAMSKGKANSSATFCFYSCVFHLLGRTELQPTYSSSMCISWKGLNLLLPLGWVFFCHVVPLEQVCPFFSSPHVPAAAAAVSNEWTVLRRWVPAYLPFISGGGRISRVASWVGLNWAKLNWFQKYPSWNENLNWC